MPAGVTYKPGSIQGVSELNIANLTRPIFIVNAVNAAQLLKGSLKIECGCEAFSKANNAEKFENRFYLEYSNKIDSFISSPPYPIISPFLVITDVPDQVIPIGASDKRTIKITNTRLGSCKTFTFSDTHGKAKISTILGKLIETSDTTLVLQFGPKDFVKIGNKDSIFDRDEMIFLEEEIEALGCGAYSIVSIFSARWGCGNEFCQEAIESATIQFTKNPVSANLNFTSTPKSPSCICSREGATQELVIKNIGSGIADSVCIDLLSYLPNATQPLGIRMNSITISDSTNVDTILYEDRIVNCNTNQVDSLYSKVRICFKEIGINQEVKIKFKWFACLNSIDYTKQLNWYYSYNYYTKCSENSKRKKEFIPVVMPKISLPIVYLVSNFVNNISTIIDKNEYTLVNDIIFSKNPTNEKLFISLLLPCPLFLKDSQFVFDGKQPTVKNIRKTGTATLVELEYRAPFSTNQLSLNVKLIANCSDSCAKNFKVGEILDLISSCPFGSQVTKSIEAKICTYAQLSCPNDEGDCGSISLSGKKLTILCDSLTNAELIIPGYLSYKVNSKRVSLGERDSDNDRFKEAGVLDTQKISDHKFITGDTLLHEIEAKIIVDDKGHTFDSIVFLVANEILIDNARAIIQYYDVNEHKYYLDTIPPEHFIITPPTLVCGESKLVMSSLGVGEQISITPELLRLSNPSIPSNFRFEEGDSIFIRFYERATNTVNDRIVNLEFTYFAFLFDRQGHFLQPFNCGNEKQIFIQTTNSHKIEVGSGEANFCNKNFILPKVTVQGSRNLDNFFPYEFRSLSYISELNFITSTFVKMDSIKMNFFYTENTILIPIKSIVFIPKFSNGWKIDPADLINLKFDESHTIEIQGFGSVEDCASIGNNIHTATIVLKVSKDFDAKFHIDPDYINLLDEYTFSRLIQIKSYNGNQEINFINKTIVSSSKLLTWDANIGNVKQPGYFTFKCRSVKGLIDGFQIKSKNSALQIKHPDSSSFIIGPIDPSMKYVLNFCAINRSCDVDTILINSFWHCGEFKPESDTCAISIFRIPVLSELPEFELDVMQDDILSNLCDTLPEISIEIYNAAKGAAYNPVLDIEIPQNIKLVPSSLKIAYPSNAAFQSLPLPTWLGGNTYRWKLEDIIPILKSRGLSGVEDIPNNGLKIKLKAITECQSSVNGYFNFELMGENNCGVMSNSISKASKAIRIKGVNTPSTLSLDFNKDSTNICNDEFTFNVNIFASDSPSSDDTISILIPIGLNYVTGSFVVISNTTFQVPIQRITSNGTLLLFGFPIIVKPGDPIRFSFRIRNFSQLGCDNTLIPIQIYQIQNAFCQTLQHNCVVLVNRASSKLNINRSFPMINLNEFQIKSTLNKIKYELKYNISGIENHTDSSFCIALYYDFDKTGQLDSKDKLIKVFEIKYRDLSSNGTYTLNSDLDIRNLEGCAFISTTVNKSCMCSIDTIYYRLKDTLEDFNLDSVCFHSQLIIGVEQNSDYKYHWIGNNVPCDSCSKNAIQFNDSNSINKVQEFVLEELTKEGCVRRIHFSFFIHPLPLPLKKILLTCPNKAITINAGTRSNFAWRGLFSNPITSYTQSLIISKDSMILLDFWDENNCMSTDTFCLKVSKNLDTLFISNDTTIMYGDKAELHVSKGYQYKWSPSDFLDCVDCSDVISTPDRTTKYTVDITDSIGCTRSLVVTVSVLFPNCDSTTFYIPNAFSPNGDKHNDIFYVRGINLTKIHLIIYNRWGEEVFESFDLNKGWDGSYKNEVLGPDVFGYYLEVECIGGKKYSKKGNVSLLK
ncbi:MAG: gliding motility-associated C-terminal domain-containing protein [Saprospiraceae bacterium]